MAVLDFLTAPFADYAFMRRALAASLILGLAGAPLGVFMTLRRMTLVGDALSHALLPGVAVAFLAAGLSVWAMAFGGFVAAAFIAVAATGILRATQMKEDAVFAVLSLLSLSAGVTLLSLRGGAADLLHLLFGNVLALDAPTLCLVAGAGCLTFFTVAWFYRRWIVEGFDPDFFPVAGESGGVSHLVFFILLMINLVAAFQALGTLLALGLTILPAIASRFWARNIDAILPLAMFLACASAYAGLLLSFYAGIGAGPAIVLTMGGLTIFSLLCGRVGSVIKSYFCT